MVPKASQRANARQLATHLLNAHDNGRVEVSHIRGAVASDLPGALEEWHAISRTTRCRKYLYSLSINPDPRQGPLTRAQYSDYIARVEQKLKLSAQPRAVVFHTKNGREHCHVVWSRINPGTLKAIPISHDRKALQAITRRFARDHGLTLSANMNPGGNPAAASPPVKHTFHERHQQERTGVSKEERIRTLTAIWRNTATAGAFIAGLEQAGYRLARGDRVPYAVIDPYGEIHSLPRQIEGARTKDLRERLAAFPSESLPHAAVVKEDIRRRNAAVTPAFNRHADAPWISLKKSQDSRRAVFRAKLAAMKDRHRTERAEVIRRQKDELSRFRAARLTSSATGLKAFFVTLPGIRHFLARRYRKDDMIYLQKCRKERQRLLIRQRAEFEDIRRQVRAIVRVEKRETRSLKTSLRREFLRAQLTGEFRAAAHDHPAINAPPSPPPPLSPEFLKAAGTTAPSRRKPSRRKPRPSSLAAAFTAPDSPDLGKAFRRAARQPASKEPAAGPRPDLA